jgi:hypothetical protein
MGLLKVMSIAGIMIPAALVIGFVFYLPIAWILMITWNFIVPVFPVLPVVSFWQAYAGLIVIMTIGSCFRSSITSVK